ncbi:enoyl-CoA hydratase-related protein [Paraburkholderia sp. J12]|uniref:enoyl-CoA hydratase-related protein n=1 Tax=Paraburkholderia sp. J12 TaxID=2805432 RepID=UPI002ABD43D2|nr:enoyl-CoA hydratase-related protein [Paraburkholderia sp. J12]
MTTDLVLVSTLAPGVACVRLNRPHVLNALNLALRRELAAAFARCDADDTVRVVVLAGGERAFCAGADLAEYVDADPLEIAGRDMGRLWDAVGGCRKPVIAAVRGYALGGGCELAMHADLIVAGTSARFGQPEVSIGLMPGGGATQRLTRAIGKFRAMQLLLTGEAIDAGEALRCGLVSEVVDDAAVEPRALALAKQLAALPVLAVRSIKEAVLESMAGTLDAGLRFERKSFQLLFATSDKTEGIRARLEKRPARFAGTPPGGDDSR